MKPTRVKKSIYTRIFSVFFAIYLLMMAGFSMFFLQQERKMAELEFGSYGSGINQRVQEILEDCIDSDHRIVDFAGLKKEFVGKPGFFTRSGTEVAVFTGDYELVYNTNDYWLCGYTEYTERNKGYTGYGYLDPREWFTEREIDEIEAYLYAFPKAEEIGDLVGYSVDLKGFWVDNEMIIPDKITVTAQSATAFDEKGNLRSSSGVHTNEIVYASMPTHIEELPYFQYGWIQAEHKGYHKTEGQAELRNMVLDTEKLQKTVGQLGTTSLSERVGAFTYRYYLPLPYRNTMKMTDEQTGYSEFWTVIARDVNIWDTCASTLAFVWVSCFITFLVAAIILSKQTYKTYKKREEMERQRKEFTDALAHDLKTPLTIISGYTQNLIENVYTEKREYYAGGIWANVNRMDRIIREILELSRLEYEASPVQSEEVSLGKVAEEVIGRYKQICEERSISVFLEGDGTVRADQSLLLRVVDNFFVNGLEHTPEGGSIYIRVLGNKFEIYNRGSHIPEDKINEIWLPYKKADTSRGNTKGTGLGLAIARTILERYKCSYGAQNMDGGVLFWFQFSER